MTSVPRRHLNQHQFLLDLARPVDVHNVQDRPHQLHQPFQPAARIFEDCRDRLCVPLYLQLRRFGAARPIVLKPNMKSSTAVYADWCGPCKAIAPIYEQLSAQLSRPQKITFVKVDIERQKEIAQKYGVTACVGPSFFYFVPASSANLDTRCSTDFLRS